MIFHALFVSFPARESSGRMRIWRALRAAGCAILRDGVYLLPESPQHATVLDAIAVDVQALHGSAEIYQLAARTEAQDAGLQALFDRAGDYAELAAEAHALRAELERLEAPLGQRRVQALGRRLEQLIAIDFFPGESRRQCLALLNELRRQLARRLSPDEPLAADKGIVRLDLRAHRNRTWATRKRPWIDRLASAWLIRRHIDPKARFVWLDSPAECHADWLGFDFDGAAFSHVGQRVTFETLLASFGLDRDPALARLGELVHYLDVGGLPVAEAVGIETLLAGLRAAEGDDDRLLANAMKVFDWLLASHQEKPRE